mmetsp:Transcript_6883/g.14616  ORF Transcript_6883/g.14616 Transcript_6883/m.14616 type:complete len:211 (-) Transcript_6883:568-1200(-)
MDNSELHHRCTALSRYFSRRIHWRHPYEQRPTSARHCIYHVLPFFWAAGMVATILRFRCCRPSSGVQFDSAHNDFTHVHDVPSVVSVLSKSATNIRIQKPVALPWKCFEVFYCRGSGDFWRLHAISGTLYSVVDGVRCSNAISNLVGRFHGLEIIASFEMEDCRPKCFRTHYQSIDTNLATIAGDPHILCILDLLGCFWNKHCFAVLLDA